MATMKAMMDERNKSDYETVPDFAARRGWDGNTLNERNYAEALLLKRLFSTFIRLLMAPWRSFMNGRHRRRVRTWPRANARGTWMASLLRRLNECTGCMWLVSFAIAQECCIYLKSVLLDASGFLR